jgi:aspartate aminotransferase-like enzyme
MQREMISHRGPEFKGFYGELLEKARAVHRTEGDVLIWPGSGSAGWEIAIANLLSPGDPVLATIAGAFGERFAAVSNRFGLDVRTLEIPWGQAITADDLAAALERDADVKAVLIAHNETSTGVTNPLPELARVARKHGALVIVDAVSAAGGIPLEVDAWDLDFVFSGSQKAWMCPPGLVIATISERAWEAYRTSRFPRFFWDIGTSKQAAAECTTPATAPLTMLYAYDAALELILDEGLPNVWSRHRRLGELARSELTKHGLELFADSAYASDTVTAFYPPTDVPAGDFLKTLKHDFGVEAQSGQGAYVNTLVRLGHMGWAHEPDLVHALSAIGAVTTKLNEDALTVAR